MQVEFDPKRIRYEDLLAVFWASHDPFGRAFSTQYEAVLWTHGEEQARLARTSAQALAEDRGREPTTAIRPATRFWIAEDYHQKYYLRSRKALLEALLGARATGAAIRESTLAARANGWVAGHGSPQEIAAACDELKVGAKAREALAAALGERAAVACR